MPVVRIKICSIIRVKDALAAVMAGTDTIDLMFYAKSPQVMDIHRAREIVRVLPPSVTGIDLFANASHCELGEVLDAVPLDLLQFHGDGRAKDCERHRRPYLRALRMKPGDDIVGHTAAYPGAAGILLNTYVEGVLGGTGAAFDWSLMLANLDKPLVLAGGLTLNNVSRTVERVKPYAVDVSGGVGASKGIKDTARVHAFVDAIRSRRHDEI